MACVSEILVNSYNSHRDRPFTKSSTCNEKKGPDLCHSNYTSISVQYQNALPSFNEVHDGNVSALLFCCDNRCNGTYIRYKFYCKEKHDAICTLHIQINVKTQFTHSGRSIFKINYWQFPQFLKKKLKNNFITR